MYNPEYYSQWILSVNKDVWLQKIEDAYHVYLSNAVLLAEYLNHDEKEEAERALNLVHNDVVKFVGSLFNKASSRVDEYTSLNAADVSTSDSSDPTEEAAENGVISDDSNEISESKMEACATITSFWAE